MLNIDKDKISNVLKKLEDKVDYADIRVGSSESKSIVLKDGKIDKINSGTDFALSLRVLQNNAWGSAFTSDMDNLDGICEDALKLSSKLTSNVVLSDPVVNEDHVKSNAKIKLSDVSVDEKMDLMIDANHACESDGIVSTNINYSESENTTLFMSSEGSDITVDNSRVAMAMNAVATNGELMQMGYKSLGGAKGFEVLKNADIESFGREVGSKALRLLKAETPPSGDFPVILDPELAGVFIHEALGHASEADLILQNDSILKDKLNTKIGSELVTVIDDASLKDGFGYYPYDVEGVKTSENILVKDGIMNSVMSSRETAGALNRQSSGNARSSIGDKPIVRMSNTYIKPGDFTFDELISDMNDGIYLKGSRGGQVDTGKGLFQFNAIESYIIKNGELVKELRDVSLSGSTLDILNNVTGVGSTFKLNIGFCGKDGQTAPVGDGGSFVRVSKATVGGAN
ncbi:MAG: TldD/PmbA family protein [Methanobacteriaceae archaeon]|nr:TldD/PmbA family protein [Methanobacteriaceae archaeon]